jgi:hypothetical protein
VAHSFPPVVALPCCCTAPPSLGRPVPPARPATAFRCAIRILGRLPGGAFVCAVCLWGGRLCLSRGKLSHVAVAVPCRCARRKMPGHWRRTCAGDVRVVPSASPRRPLPQGDLSGVGSVLALSNGYMGLALFDAAPAPLPRYPSAPAGHHCSVSSTLSLTGACVAQKEGALARGGLR